MKRSVVFNKNKKNSDNQSLHRCVDTKTGERVLIPERVYSWFEARSDSDLRQADWSQVFSYLIKDKIWLACPSEIARSSDPKAIQLIRRLTILEVMIQEPIKKNYNCGST